MSWSVDPFTREGSQVRSLHRPPCSPGKPARLRFGVAAGGADEVRAVDRHHNRAHGIDVLKRHSAAPLGRKATDLAALSALAVILAGDLRPDRNPTKRWPIQLVPVIALAITDRLP